MDARSEISPAFLTQTQDAPLLGVPGRTLEGWRLTTSGPPWLKLGRHVRYDEDDVLGWPPACALQSHVICVHRDKTIDVALPAVTERRSWESTP